MNPDRTPDTASPKRRLLVAGLGVGACAAAVGILRWPSSAPAENTASTPPAVPASKEAAPTLRVDENVPATAVIPGELSREWFLPHLNTEFEMTASEQGTSNMKLVAVSEARPLKSDTTNYSGFSLFFDAPLASGTVDGAIYHVRHARLGDMDLFLTPVGKPGNRLTLEAAFTRKA